MKITGPGGIFSTTARKTRRARDSDGAGFASRIPTETIAAPPLARGGPLESIDALLAIQSTHGGTEGRSRALARSNALLDQLEEIRLGLLGGALRQSDLVKLVEYLQRADETTSDPILAAILGEIEVRAAVELAKLGVPN